MQKYTILKEYENVKNKRQFLIKCGNCEYVLKVAKGENEKAFLMREVQMTGVLKNIINVPNVIDYWQEKDALLVIEEKIVGKTLSEERTIEDVKNLAKALKKLHSVKCDNTIDKCLIIAKMRMENNELNASDFIVDGKDTEPSVLFEYLVKNKSLFKDCCILNGNLNLDTIVKTSENKLVFCDWGATKYGDPYLDLASIMWSFNGEENKAFFKEYGIENIDGSRLLYADYLSRFLKS